MINRFFTGYTITTTDRSELLVDFSLDGWGGNIGLIATDGSGKQAITQLNLEEARELARALSAAVGALEHIVDPD